MSEPYQLYFGGQIHTVDDPQPRVEAVAVADGRILATGSPEQCPPPSDLPIDPSI